LSNKGAFYRAPEAAQLLLNIIHAPDRGGPERGPVKAWQIH
jgi:hypothetical protein